VKKSEGVDDDGDIIKAAADEDEESGEKLAYSCYFDAIFC
jgi:hypothetical protein